MARTVEAIKTDLDRCYTRRIEIATSAKSYSLDTGQSRQQVENVDLDMLNKTIGLLEKELADAEYSAGGTPVISGIPWH